MERQHGQEYSAPSTSYYGQTDAEFKGKYYTLKELIQSCSHLILEHVRHQDLHHKIFQTNSKTESNWTASPVGNISIEVDGSVRSNSEAACGGILEIAMELGFWDEQ